MKDQGGLGRFQIFSFIIITLQTNSVGWIIYNLGLITMQPIFICQKTTDGTIIPHGTPDYDIYCIKDYFCLHDDVHVTVDPNDKYSLNNWV